MFIRVTQVLSFSRLNDLYSRRYSFGVFFERLFFVQFDGASIERLVYLLDGYKACFGSVLLKNCTDFTLSHVLGCNSK